MLLAAWWREGNLAWKKTYATYPENFLEKMTELT